MVFSLNKGTVFCIIYLYPEKRILLIKMMNLVKNCAVHFFFEKKYVAQFHCSQSPKVDRCKPEFII